MGELLFARPDGRLTIDRTLGAAGRSGWEIMSPDRLIPLPEQATLVHLPGRRPIGLHRHGGPATVRAEGAMALAAILPPGYLRTLLPAYEEAPGAPVLPLFGYAAVGAVKGVPHVAALRTDRWDAWNPGGTRREGIPRAIAGATRALPKNRLVPHLATCATAYRCLTAQNVFLRRGEAAIPVSPACNAACLGCISEQWGDVDSPQDRLPFAPTADEIAELAAWHLQASAANFVSFGQGCEGEPLTRGQPLVEATRRIRSAAPAATVHINTNGSRPVVLERLLAAGLNSARISVFSLDDARFRAYYRPMGYGLEQVAACADLLRGAGAQLTLNLLTFPGITDARDEIENLVRFVNLHGVHQVQLRSLNVDPLWLLSRIPQQTTGIGMRPFLAELRERLPSLKLGNFTRPWPVGRPLGVEPASV